MSIIGRCSSPLSCRTDENANQVKKKSNRILVQAVTWRTMRMHFRQRNFHRWNDRDWKWWQMISYIKHNSKAICLRTLCMYHQILCNSSSVRTSFSIEYRKKMYVSFTIFLFTHESQYELTYVWKHSQQPNVRLESLVQFGKAYGVEYMRLNVCTVHAFERWEATLRYLTTFERFLLRLRRFTG